ncbi:AraC family transcriptional regulator [Desulfitobacterium hafniense]|uniref:AraC family transcriptional regulator n=1 Tax=Desulfitobacterium hafniense TaxID=49338 RepID=A0A098B3K1_DESHA|nr:AraC family transcriptional regulator [Desulfitobacterium hafniense]KTE89992.1 AraC family transcriptional regulator [Desulfitobacterium hafniense]CDX02942.1 Transcriptional regulator, AraC [Desulfitobacterium hafniense]
MSNIEQAYRGYGFAGRGQKNGCTVYQLKGEGGSGEMVCYDIAPGIQMSFNQLTMDSTFQSIAPVKKFLQIDYCIEGCYEVEYQNGTVSFLGEGDLCVTDLSRQVFVSSRLPLRKYRGVTLFLEVEKAQHTLAAGFPQAEINLAGIVNELCGKEQSLLVKSREDVERIFSKLSEVDERIQAPYYWIKTMELLLFLSVLDEGQRQPLKIFSGEVARSTKAVYHYILENPLAKVTISELASQFDITESSLKRCFRSISGSSIGTFMKAKRMEAAAELLTAGEKLSIGEIAERAGYENQSKFSAAFKSVYGVTPLLYQNRHL